MVSILAKQLRASAGAPGNCFEKEGGSMSGNFRKNRLAFSDVTKSKSSSLSLPSFSLIIVSCKCGSMCVNVRVCQSIKGGVSFLLQ